MTLKQYGGCLQVHRHAQVFVRMGFSAACMALETGLVDQILDEFLRFVLFNSVRKEKTQVVDMIIIAAVFVMVKFIGAHSRLHRNSFKSR
jgi:hypothetical protein